MRAPPPTALTIGQPVAWRWVRAGLAGLAVASLAGWGAGALWAAPEALQLLGGACAGICAAFAVGARLRDPTGQLRWTGSGWEWQPQDGQLLEIAQLDLMVDLHAGVLLRLRPRDARAFWLAARASADAPAWRAFRAAVYSAASRSLGPMETEPPRP